MRRFARGARLLLLVYGLVFASGVHAQTAPEARYRDRTLQFRAQVGATFGIDAVDHYVDGRPIDPSSDKGLRPFVEGRLALMHLTQRWLALGGVFGVTNWRSDFMRRAGYLRSNFLTFGLQPELRLPLGSCFACPTLALAATAAFVLSQRDKRAPRASVEQYGRWGPGYSLGARVGIEIPFHPVVGFRIEHGFEYVRMRHEVDYEGLGSERLEFVLRRQLTLIGPWVRL